jgi:rhamnogalacturonan acetylesterase
MISSHILSLLALSSAAFAAPNAKRAQTVYLAGDSTMADYKDNTEGTALPRL